MSTGPVQGNGAGAGLTPVQKLKAEMADASKDEALAYITRAANRFAEPIKDQYFGDVQPAVAHVCAGCHACATAGCNAKMTDSVGMQRGANDISAVPLHVLGTDDLRPEATNTPESAKEAGFYPVFQGGRDSIAYKLISAALDHNTVEGFDTKDGKKLYDSGAISYRWNALRTASNAVKRLHESPGAGMPLAVKLTEKEVQELQAVLKWIEDGAPEPTAEAKAIAETPLDPVAVKKWEDFFNQDTTKGKLSMRYIYEHIGFGKFHIDDSATGLGDYFEIVRSRTKDGPIDEIVTETDNADPKGKFYYRLKKHTGTIMAQDTTLFRLTDKVKDRWEEQFLKGDWDPGAKIPGYETKNPFKNFEQLPAKIRYQFMLENNHALIEAMVKGAV